VADEVLQSGSGVYTVFLVDRHEYVRNLRERSESDLSAELLELARRASAAVTEARRRRRYRDYLP